MVESKRISWAEIWGGGWQGGQEKCLHGFDGELDKKDIMEDLGMGMSIKI